MIVSTRVVAEFLGPPSKYHWKRRQDYSSLDPDDALRQIQLAEAKLKFGSAGSEKALANWHYERVLRLLPNSLALHHKVWQMLIATRRQSEAELSYRST